MTKETVVINDQRKFWDRNRRSGGYLLKHRTSQIAVSVIRGLLMFGLCFMIIQPLITRFARSLMEERDLYDSTIVLLPRHATLINYKYVADLTGFPGTMITTLWISLLVSACQVVAATLVSYGFARFEFPLKKFWFACVVMLIIIPPQTISPALYMTFAQFDLFGLRIFESCVCKFGLVLQIDMLPGDLGLIGKARAAEHRRTDLPQNRTEHPAEIFKLRGQDIGLLCGHPLR